MNLNIDKVNKPWISFLTESQLKELEEELECSICLNIYNDPIITNCHHIFCKNCLNGAFHTFKNCPLCREKVIKINYNPEKVVSIVKKSLGLGKSENALDVLKTEKDKIQYENCLAKIQNYVTRGQQHRAWWIKLPKDLKENVYFKLRHYVEQKGFFIYLSFNKFENQFFGKLYQQKEEVIK